MTKNALAQNIASHLGLPRTDFVSHPNESCSIFSESIRFQLSKKLNKLPPAELLPLSLLKKVKRNLNDPNVFVIQKNSNSLLEFHLEKMNLPLVQKQSAIKSDLLHKNIPSQVYNNHLKLLSLNVWGLPQLCGMGSIDPHRFEIITDQLKKGSDDIVLLQEMWDSQTNSILENSGFPYIGKATKDGLIHGSGLITLSRFPILETEFLQFSETSGLERFVKKGALRTRIRLPSDDIIDVINVHFASPPEKINKLFVSYRHYEEIIHAQLQELRLWLSQRNSAPDMTIVGGDFNIREDHKFYPEMKNAFGVDVYRLRHGVEGYSWCDDNLARVGFTFDPSFNSYARRSQYHPERIDYFWIDEKNIENAACGSQMRFTSEHVSDHFGVELTIAWSKIDSE
jgi:endonuclease/exonuclease/phosphatase family metal-dependent hydrolase